MRYDLILSALCISLYAQYDKEKDQWSRAAGDPEYIAAFQQIVMPICYEVRKFQYVLAGI